MHMCFWPFIVTPQIGDTGPLHFEFVQQASIITDRKVNCVYPWCNMLVHVDDLRGHLETFHLFSQWNRKKCKYCKGQVDLSVLEVCFFGRMVLGNYFMVLCQIILLVR